MTEEHTPVFDAVLGEQGHKEMPLPPTETHAEFMARHGHDDWLASLEQTIQYERPKRKANLPQTAPVKVRGKR